jgi:hypothetical protein
MSVACILFVEEAVLITTRCKTLGFITVITKDYQTQGSVFVYVMWLSKSTELPSC